MSNRSEASRLSQLTPALWVHRGGAPAMGEFHRHDDLELNVVLDGDLEYLFGGERLVIPAGHTALFWAAAPHRLIASDARPSSEVCWIHVPLRAALRWTLPASFGTEILAQRTVIVPTAALGRARRGPVRDLAVRPRHRLRCPTRSCWRPTRSC